MEQLLDCKCESWRFYTNMSCVQKGKKYVCVKAQGGWNYEISVLIYFFLWNYFFFVHTTWTRLSVFFYFCFVFVNFSVFWEIFFFLKLTTFWLEVRRDNQFRPILYIMSELLEDILNQFLESKIYVHSGTCKMCFKI